MMNQHRSRLVWVCLVGVMIWGHVVPSLGAETFGYASRKPQLWETERPVLEEEPGTNLYWHDPHLGSWETCRIWPPATNGCPPSWYAKGEMMALYRDTTEIPFATVGRQGPVMLGTGNFDTDFSAGVRAMVGKTLGDWYRLEGLYFGSYSWDDSAAVRNVDANTQGGTGNLFSPFSAFGSPAGVVGLDYNNFASLRFNSTLNNGEINLRRRILMRPGSYEASCLFGGRYMRIGEDFDYLTQSTVPGPNTTSNEVAIETDNSMIGLQVGLLSQVLVQPKCWVDFEMKGGIFSNRAELDRTYTVSTNGGAAAIYTGADQCDRTSFVGDLSLQVNYQFAPSWTVFGGYNAIWVTGLANAAENFTTDVSVLTLGPASIDHDGVTVYHGPNIGIVFTH
jgi:hypothetical protein